MNKSILIVEDEIPLSAVIKNKCESHGLNTVTARSVDQARQFLKENMQINAIWLDHYLIGKENGLDFVAELKTSEGPYQNIPIFVVSNTASEDKIQSYLQLGVTKYYTKVNHPLEDLISEIINYIDLESDQE